MPSGQNRQKITVEELFLVRFQAPIKTKLFVAPRTCGIVPPSYRLMTCIVLLQYNFGQHSIINFLMSLIIMTFFLRRKKTPGNFHNQFIFVKSSQINYSLMLQGGEEISS